MATDPPIAHGDQLIRVRTTVTLDVKTALKVQVAEGYKFLYSVYKNGVRQAYEASAWQTAQEKSFQYGAGTYTIYLTIATSDGTSNVTPSDAEKAVAILADNAVDNIYDSLSVVDALKEVKNLYDPEANNTLRGYYNASNTWVTSYDFGQTDYIPVEQGVRYVSSFLSVPVLWFDSSKDFLSSVSSQNYKGWVTPPTGAAYVKFVIPTASHTSFYVHSDEVEQCFVLAVVAVFARTGKVEEVETDKQEESYYNNGSDRDNPSLEQHEH